VNDENRERLATDVDVSSTSNLFRMNQQRNMLSKPWLFCVGVISFIALFSLFGIPFTKSSPGLTNSKVGIIHVVMFEFKEEVKTEEITDVCDRMLELKDQCIHPTTKSPYIKMAVGGKQSSPEGLTGGITHTFVVQFENEEDRKYYLEKDPAHLAFKNSLGAVVKKVQVVDFTPGTF